MKRYQSGAEKRKKLKRIQEISEDQKNAMNKFIIVNRDEPLPTSSHNTISENKSASEDKQKVEVDSMSHKEEENLQNKETEFASRKKYHEETKDNSSESTKLKTYISNDIALWPTVLSDAMIEHITINKPKNIGRIETLKSVYKDRDQTYYRGLSHHHFYRTKTNGTKEERSWLVFSETSKSIYCYPCKLFSTTKSKLISGFGNWKTITTTLSDHEVSKDHMSSMCTLYKRALNTNRIDTNLLQQRECEQNYWREVLRRIVSTIKLISRLGLAFRGHDEGQNSNRKGNYLTCLEYLSEYDNFLKQHIDRYSHRGRGNINYLSHNICDEFISLLSKNVEAFIVEEIISSNYYSLILDSTPDVSHIDQLTLIIRYVLPNGDIKERFLGFVPIEEHASSYLEEQVLLWLSKLGIDIKFCRGQTYDNAANMSGRYRGLQARIKEHSPCAVYIPCASHSLNLVGNFAAESCSAAIHFFMFVQKLFTFFSASTHRWQILYKKLEKSKHPKTIKRLSDTRWSARADAILALKTSYFYIKEALSYICSSKLEKKITVVEAKSLLKKMNKYETVLMTVIWNTILQRVNATSKSLQSIECTLFKGSSLLTSLEKFIIQLRNEFTNIEKEATEMTSETFEEQSERHRTNKRGCFFDEGNETSVKFSTRENFIVNTFNVICDNILTELVRRSEIYKNNLENFRIFFDLNLPSGERKEYADKLKNIYSADIDVTQFDDELEHFLEFLKQDQEKYNTATQIYEAAREMSSTFPYVANILKIFLTIPISNSSGERSFSALKRVKNYLRSTITEERLNCLALLYIEQDILNSIDTSNIINAFAKQKSRKKFI